MFSFLLLFTCVRASNILKFRIHGRRLTVAYLLFYEFLEPAMPDFSQLTPRQREIYDFIREKIERRGYGPTVREIGLGFAIKSPNGVMCHLKALEKKGLILREGHAARAIQLVDHRPVSGGLPLLGTVAAGVPCWPSRVMIASSSPIFSAAPIASSCGSKATR